MMFEVLIITESASVEANTQFLLHDLDRQSSAEVPRCRDVEMPQDLTNSTFSMTVLGAKHKM